MRDYFKVAMLPRNANRLIDDWRAKEGFQNRFLKMYALEAHEWEGVFSRFVIFVSENAQQAQEVEACFEDWIQQPEQEQYFSWESAGDRTQQGLPESAESSILLFRRSRLINSGDILPRFHQNDQPQLRRDLLRSVWQVISTRGSNLPVGMTGHTWEYFTKQRLVPSIFIPPDSVVGLQSLQDSVAGAVKTILFHRDRVFDDYMVYAATNETYQANVGYQLAQQRMELPRDPNSDQLTQNIVNALTAHWA